jgi:phage gp29-like protein
MGLWARIKDALVSPSKLEQPTANVHAKPLNEQFQRIGGGMTPQQVSNILRQADSGQPAQLVELFNESRQKDGHLQGICGTRDGAVALCPISFVVPEDADAKAQEAVRLCQRVVDEFDNWPTLIEHLTNAYIPGHATAQILPWEKTKDGYLLPRRCEPVDARSFVFGRETGKLLYVPSAHSQTGYDLLADNPGRIVQIQRRIVGDVPVREGLIRVLVWAALFRNWGLKDWMSLGEVGWKPWRWAVYEDGTHQSVIDQLVDQLSQWAATGVGAFPKSAKPEVAWASGGASNTAGTHQPFFLNLGYEMSKAVLGQTTSTEVAGPHGDRASTQTRDQVRIDIRERDAVADAAVLRAQFFRFVVEVNLGPDVMVPVPWFQTDEAVDQVKFADMIGKLKSAGARIPARWVRDEVGMPEPKKGEEVLGDGDPEEEDDGNEEDPDEGDDSEE